MIMKVDWPDPSWDKGTIAAWNKIRIDVLAAIYLSPVITGDAEEDTDTVLLRWGCPIWDHSCHLERLVGSCDG